jgi:hypothetical protein
MDIKKSLSTILTRKKLREGYFSSVYVSRKIMNQRWKAGFVKTLQAYVLPPAPLLYFISALLVFILLNKRKKAKRNLMADQCRRLGFEQ